MKYVSTRGGVAPTSFASAILSGYAPDGGLYVPQYIPKLSLAEVFLLRTASFQDLCVTILSKFISKSEISSEDLRKVVDDSFSLFHDERIIPTRRVGSVLMGELFHGPTYAFKDFGQQVLCKLVGYFARKRNEHVVLCVSTTGDTGPAAIRGVQGQAPHVSIFCSFPKGQVSRLQQLQMTTVNESNVTVIQYEGTSDGMDPPIKSITTPSSRSEVEYKDPLERKFQAAKKKFYTCSVNSINWGRIVIQSVHWWWCYLRLVDQGLPFGQPAVFSVPCGALGNITAGLYAFAMGMPVKKFVCGTNDNDIFNRVCQTGDFITTEFKRTLSEAINIEVPYNFERVHYLMIALYEGNRRASEIIRPWMLKRERENGNSVSARVLSRLQSFIHSVAVSDEDMINTIRMIWQKHQYILDPHSAVAVFAAQSLGYAKEADPKHYVDIVCLATAHACKFEEAIKVALGERFWATTMKKYMPDGALELYNLPEVHDILFTRGENWTQRLKKLIVDKLPPPHLPLRSRL